MSLNPDPKMDFQTKITGRHILISDWCNLGIRFASYIFSILCNLSGEYLVYLMFQRRRVVFVEPAILHSFKILDLQCFVVLNDVNTGDNPKAIKSVYGIGNSRSILDTKF